MEEKAPTIIQLREAAEQFSKWVRATAPGAEVLVSGGFSVNQLGGARTTKDVDLCIDMRKALRPGTTRRFDINFLKDKAREDTEHFTGSLKIFWRLADIDVQVDFVDAMSYWSPPEILSETVILPHTDLHSLNAPSLLVGKIISAGERAQPDPVEKRQKQESDLTDATFLAELCAHGGGGLLNEAHKKHLRDVSSMKRLTEVFDETGTDKAKFVGFWNALVASSSFGEEWKM